MTEITADDGEVYEVDSAPDDLKFYHQWSLDTRRQNMDFTNEILRRLVTLTGVLLGGGVALINDKTMLPIFQVLTLGAFFAALAVSFVGMMPYDAHAHPDVPDQFREAQERAFAWKTRLISIAGACIGFGFVLAVIGLVVRRLA